MNILITVASKHGSTREIAEAIAQEIRSAGHSVDLHDADGAPAPQDYDAIVAGSAIYIGNWMGEAKAYVDRHHEQLAQRPVWLFSSGPLGEDYPEDMGKPQNLDELMSQTGARDHQVFVGRLDKSELGLGERVISRAVKAPEGDFRDWDAIRAWARQIAATLNDSNH